MCLHALHWVGAVGTGEDRQEGCQTRTARAGEGAWLPSGVWAAGYSGAGGRQGDPEHCQPWGLLVWGQDQQTWAGTEQAARLRDGQHSAQRPHNRKAPSAGRCGTVPSPPSQPPSTVKHRWHLLGGGQCPRRPEVPPTQKAKLTAALARRMCGSLSGVRPSWSALSGGQAPPRLLCAPTSSPGCCPLCPLQPAAHPTL